LRIAVIPARGGSKRVPRKNIRAFAGLPMISYSIAAASRAGLFDRIIVSTDDEEIAGVAKSCGAEVPFMRPAELSDDRTGTMEVVAHAIDYLGADGVSGLSSVCCIYATAPFIRHSDLRLGLEILESGQWQYVFAATDFAAPIFRSFRKDASGGLEMFFPQYFPVRSQDLPEALHDAGQFYWGRPAAWLSRAAVFDRLSTVVLLPRWRVHDIDTEDDWRRAELVWNALDAGRTDDGIFKEMDHTQ
jgi:pseudaminic acid cytidylyltransferase